MVKVKPLNLFAAIVLLNPIAADATINNGALIKFAGIQDGIKIGDIVGYKKTAYAAGTLQVATIDFTATPAVNSTEYSFKVRPNKVNSGTEDPPAEITVKAFTPSTGTTAAVIAQRFTDSVNNNPGRIFNATIAGNVVTLTERDARTEGFLITEVPTAAVATVTVAHVVASGSIAEVAQYDSTIVSGQYARYEYTIRRKENHPTLNADLGANEVKVIVWANESGGSFAAFDAKVTQVNGATNITDAAVRPYVNVG